MDNTISQAKLAEITVDVAAVLRKHGVNCRHNESLNCLQSALADQYLNYWLGLEIKPQYGAYDYWEAAHQRAGIERPKS